LADDGQKITSAVPEKPSILKQSYAKGGEEEKKGREKFFIGYVLLVCCSPARILLAGRLQYNRHVLLRALQRRLHLQLLSVHLPGRRLVGRGIANPQEEFSFGNFENYLKAQKERNIRQIMCYARKYGIDTAVRGIINASYS
jgi:hypothetical protein